MQEEKQEQKTIPGDMPVAMCRGVGEKRAEAFAKMGVSALSDLLPFYPRAYQNRGDVRELSQIREITGEGETITCSAVLTIGTEPQVRMVKRGMMLLKFAAFDDTGTCEVTYFHADYLKGSLHMGATYRFFGQFRFDYGRVQVTNPIFEPWVEGKVLPEIVPVYPLSAGLNQRLLYQCTSEALNRLGTTLTEYLPAWILREASLPDYRWMVHVLHRPQNPMQLEAARKRLVFEELFLQFVCMAQNGGGARIPNRYPLTWQKIDAFTDKLPYTLTDAQLLCLREITADMASEYAMNRILIGDVGSGKTVVAALSAYLAIRSGYRVALLVPTEILANQHARELTPLFAALGIGTVLLTGSTPKKKRETILASLRDDRLTLDDDTSSSLIIGTHALLTEDVQIDRLGLVIIDEQHRFGVMQRSAILEKGEDCHCLFLSATPIPRTLSLVAYGSLAVSSIDAYPTGRQPIDTFIVNSSYHARMLNFIRKQAAEGHQTYIVCPAVEEQKKEKVETDAENLTNLSLFDLAIDKTDDAMQLRIDNALTPPPPPLKAATVYAQTLAEELPELSVGLIHGKMKPAEKDAVMDAFCRGETQVLVATTVIEVGVNVPTATLMIVENAERFGLSQLHQLRGRVGRGTAKSFFILVSDTHDPQAMARLKTLKDTISGYEIAQADLEMRGAGDFITGTGVRQSGQSMFRLAASCRDTDFMEHTARLAKELIAEDPTLSEHPLLREKVDRIRYEGSRMEN